MFYDYQYIAKYSIILAYIESIEEVDDVQIDDAVVERLGFKDFESALATLNQFSEQRLIECYTSLHRLWNTSKRNKILMCTRISSNYFIFILPLCLQYMMTFMSYTISFLIYICVTSFLSTTVFYK